MFISTLPSVVGKVKHNKYFFWNHTCFQQTRNDGVMTSAVCAEANPQCGYGLGSVIEIENDTPVSLAEETNAHVITG